MMPSAHRLREAQREPGGGQVAAGAHSDSASEAHAGMHEAAADDRPSSGKAPVRRHDVQTIQLRLPVNGMEAARGRRAGSQPPQLGQEITAATAAEHGTAGSLGVPVGGTSRVPFKVPTGGTAKQGDKIRLGSFFTAEAAARAHDG
jgi:hypothetical protein